ncbi:MAG TPA: hypothetical protein VE135_16020 [Pyrinomonadaceae bacterium]|nr:hypothetical protein [Pyrinomonadaceae bacterium]
MSHDDSFPVLPKLLKTRIRIAAAVLELVLCLGQLTPPIRNNALPEER